MEPAANLGFMNFISQGDFVTYSLFIILIGMSILSWLVIFLKFFQALADRLKTKKFLNAFWSSPSLNEVANNLSEKPGTPHETLAKTGVEALLNYRPHGESLQNAGTKDEYLTRVLRVSLDKIQLSLENGVTLLATIAATAPFVGLFGTVWGIYHALIEIGSTGAGTIDKVAGPVGEALIMTGLGLAVAIPAVMAHSWVTRRNRLKMGYLDSFAFELLSVLESAEPIRKSQSRGGSPAATSVAEQG